MTGLFGKPLSLSSSERVSANMMIIVIIMITDENVTTLSLHFLTINIIELVVTAKG